MISIRNQREGLNVDVGKIVLELELENDGSMLEEFTRIRTFMFFERCIEFHASISWPPPQITLEDLSRAPLRVHVS